MLIEESKTLLGGDDESLLARKGQLNESHMRSTITMQSADMIKIVQGSGTDKDTNKM